MEQKSEIAVEQRLEQWLTAARMAYKIGTIGSRPQTAEMMFLYARLSDIPPKLPEGKEHDLDSINAPSLRKEFFNEFLAMSGMAQLIDKRFRSGAYQWELEDQMVMYIALEVDNPGEAVMLLTYCYLNQITCLTELATHVIPFGMPTRQALSALWDLQKTSTGNNAVDMVNAVNNVYKKRHAEEQ